MSDIEATLAALQGEAAARRIRDELAAGSIFEPHPVPLADARNAEQRPNATMPRRRVADRGIEVEHGI